MFSRTMRTRCSSMPMGESSPPNTTLGVTGRPRTTGSSSRTTWRIGAGPSAGWVHRTLVQGQSGGRVPEAARCVRRTTEASSRGWSATRSRLAVWKDAYAIRAKTGKAYRGRHSGAAEHVAEVSEEAQTRTGANRGAVPVSSKQQARLEQERAAQKQEKKIGKARSNVDPDSAGSGNQAAQLKKPKVSSLNQGK